METCNLFSKSDASSAVDTSVHVGDYKGTDIFVLDCSLELVISTVLISIEVRVILQIALSSLITDRTVERVIS